MFNKISEQPIDLQGTIPACKMRDHRDKPTRLLRELSRLGGVEAEMNSQTRLLVTRTARLALLGGAGLALAGCGHRPIIVQTPAPTVIQSPAPAPAPAVATVAAPMAPPPIVVVNQPPPPPKAETQAPSPSPQHVWIQGYWAWRNNQQQWVPGHWELPPRTGATWVPARWDQRGSDYVFVDGYWQ